MARCRRFIINKLDAVPREEAVVNNYKIEHVTYPIIKLARELYRGIDREEALDFVKRELALDIGEAVLDMGLLKFTYEPDEWGVRVRADLEVVDKRDKSI